MSNRPPAPIHRLKSVFPPGFDSAPPESKGHPGHYTHSTEQLYVALIDNYSPMTGAESIRVKSAWYGKQTNSTEHEFILIRVEDARDEMRLGEGLINYLVLDRSILSKRTRSARAHTHSQTSVQGGQPVDTFKVSYDGDVQRLLEDCNLQPHRYLEQLHFSPDNPLLLYELVTLAYIVSYRQPQYRSVDSNGPSFAGLIWDSLCELHPAATRNEPPEKKKGKYGWFRTTPDRSEVTDICKQTSEAITQGRSRIDSQKAVSFVGSPELQYEVNFCNPAWQQLEALIRDRIAKMERDTLAPVRECTIQS